MVAGPHGPWSYASWWWCGKRCCEPSPMYSSWVGIKRAPSAICRRLGIESRCLGYTIHLSRLSIPVLNEISCQTPALSGFLCMVVYARSNAVYRLGRPRSLSAPCSRLYVRFTVGISHGECQAVITGHIPDLKLPDFAAVYTTSHPSAVSLLGYVSIGARGS
ncbi:hypothetical protein F4802DRAFT_522407 [Xylaria palmicola]|nr:hypothetical protein F4802DRAFT_522407 [Xylaria palmicola]